MKRNTRIWVAFSVLAACLAWLAPPVMLRAADDDHESAAAIETAADGHDEAEHHDAAHDDAAHADADHGHAVGNTNPLSIDLDLAMFTLIMFVVLFIVLKKFAWGPICEALDERERGIADNIASAQQMNADAKALLSQYDEKIAKAHDEVRLLLEEARRDAEHTQQGILAKANEEADSMRKRAVADIETAKVQALKEVSERGAAMAVDLAGRIIQAEVKPDDHVRLIEAALAEVPGPAPSQN
ncbi:MAG: F0F1 ATP synthase subunit B [Pirellulales bacterium]|nr:F0F1 ATP synthase subunit B [Planctomycetales bacterium]